MVCLLELSTCELSILRDGLKSYAYNKHNLLHSMTAVSGTV